jgi:hypothetical protein
MSQNVTKSHICRKDKNMELCGYRATEHGEYESAWPILEIGHSYIQTRGLQQEKKTILQNAENGQLKAVAH